MEKAKFYGHRKMIVWQNLDQLCLLVYGLVHKIPRSNYKLIRQIEAAMDSVGANFVEGYYSGSLLDYLRFCRYGKRSLAEVQERLRRCYFRLYFQQNEYQKFEDLAIKTMYMFDRLINALEKKAEEGQRRPKRAMKAEEGYKRLEKAL